MLLNAHHSCIYFYFVSKEVSKEEQFPFPHWQTTYCFILCETLWHWHSDTIISSMATQWISVVPHGPCCRGWSLNKWCKGMDWYSMNSSAAGADFSLHHADEDWRTQGIILFGIWYSFICCCKKTNIHKKRNPVVHVKCNLYKQNEQNQKSISHPLGLSCF